MKKKKKKLAEEILIRAMHMRHLEVNDLGVGLGGKGTKAYNANTTLVMVVTSFCWTNTKQIV